MVTTTNEQMVEMHRALNAPNAHRNEKVWTYLIADILCNSKLRNKHIACFCDKDTQLDDSYRVWFEAQPLVPRKGQRGKTEGNTRLDLAFGSIKRRGCTKAGIEFDPNSYSSWVCFVESKYFADQSISVTHDPDRNQIIRIIENLLCFQGKSQFPKRLFFVLLTPRVFKQSQSEFISKSYSETFWKYENNQRVLSDIEQSPFPIRSPQSNWKYPESLVDRVQCLSRKWITFEEIFEREYDITEIDISSPKIHPILKEKLNMLADDLQQQILSSR